MPRRWGLLAGRIGAVLPAMLGMALAGCAKAEAPVRLQAPTALQAPWTAAIGELDVGNDLGGSGQHCSAVLIAADTIVTAAHCLFLGSNRAPASPYSLIFTPNKGALPALPPSRGVAFKSVGGIIHGGRLRDQDVGNDWAVVTISPPVAGVQPLPVAELPVSGMLQLVASGDRLVTAGYGNGSYDELRVHPPCRIIPSTEIGIRSGDDIVITSCEFRVGDAGGPILLIDGAGQPALVGIFSGFGRNPKTAEPLGLGVNARNFNLYLRQPAMRSNELQNG
ncbi:MAG TPA: trypsin-like serine protease [Roseomonas sp.]